MVKINKQSDQPIFEMILDAGTNDQPSFVYASPSQAPREETESWQTESQEGQLALDVIETKKEVLVISTMAGSDTSKIEVYIHNDLLTIRGRRDLPVDKNQIINYFHEECFWGAFSRSVVLPIEVKGDMARAEYKNGILVVRVPRQKTDTKIPVRIVEE